MIDNGNPCHFCTDDRNETCHITCQKFVDWDREHRRKKAEESKKEYARKEIFRYKHAQNEKVRRSLQRKGKL